MAFLLRLRKFPTLPNRFPTHHRLLSTDLDSPPLLREVSEAVKQLDPTPSSGFPPPRIIKSFKSEPLEEEEMKASIEWFNDGCTIDRYLISGRRFNRHASFHEILREITKFNTQFAVHTLNGNIVQPETKKTMRVKLNTILKSFKRLREISSEDGEFSTALISSRLAPFEELVNNLKKDVEDDFCDEFDQVCMRRKKMVLEEVEFESNQAKGEQDFISSRIEKLSVLCRTLL